MFKGPLWSRGTIGAKNNGKTSKTGKTKTQNCARVGALLDVVNAAAAKYEEHLDPSPTAAKGAAAAASVSDAAPALPEASASASAAAASASDSAAAASAPDSAAAAPSE